MDQLASRRGSPAYADAPRPTLRHGRSSSATASCVADSAREGAPLRDELRFLGRRAFPRMPGGRRSSAERRHPPASKRSPGTARRRAPRGDRPGRGRRPGRLTLRYRDECSASPRRVAAGTPWARRLAEGPPTKEVWNGSTFGGGRIAKRPSLCSSSRGRDPSPTFASRRPGPQRNGDPSPSSWPSSTSSRAQDGAGPPLLLLDDGLHRSSNPGAPLAPRPSDRPTCRRPSSRTTTLDDPGPPSSEPNPPTAWEVRAWGPAGAVLAAADAVSPTVSLPPAAGRMVPVLGEPDPRCRARALGLEDELRLFGGRSRHFEALRVAERVFPPPAGACRGRAPWRGFRPRTISRPTRRSSPRSYAFRSGELLTAFAAAPGWGSAPGNCGSTSRRPGSPRIIPVTCQPPP